MAAVGQFIAHLYAVTVVFFTLLLVEAAIRLRSLAGAVCASDEDAPPDTPGQYLELIEARAPALRHRGFARAECAVCLSGFEEGDAVRELRCRHGFHRDCLDGWLRQGRGTCPICRRAVFPEVGLRPPREQAEYDGSDEELMLLLSALRGNCLRRLLWS